jgi:hypothetical protein
MSHNSCDCGHEHHTHASNPLVETPVIKANANVALRSLMSGIAKIISTYEEITGAKVATNVVISLTHAQVAEIPEGRVALMKAAYARNLKSWHPEDKESTEKRVIEAPGMITAFDLSPTLLTQVPEDPAVLMSEFSNNVVDHPGQAGGPLVVMAGRALYLKEVDSLLAAFPGTADLSEEDVDKVSTVLGVPTIKNLANGTAK